VWHKRGIFRIPWKFFQPWLQDILIVFFSHVRHQRGTFRILGKFFEIVIVWKNRIVFTFFYFLAQLVTFWILETFSDHHCMGNSFFFFFMSDMNVTGSRSWGSFFTSKLCEIFFVFFFTSDINFTYLKCFCFYIKKEWKKLKEGGNYLEIEVY